MIKLTQVSKLFSSGINQNEVLKDLNIEIKEGELVALIGPSGSGKTTLLNIIGGLDTPSSGEVKVGNRLINKLKDKPLSNFRNDHIGFVFQEFHLEPKLTVLENILLPTYFGKTKQNKEKQAINLIEEVKLNTKINTPVSQLSGGQKQRTAIARALINEPKIILADEPTGNLDIKTGKTIINLLKTIHQRHNTTLIIATHDLEIANIADKKIHLRDGEINTI